MKSREKSADAAEIRGESMQRFRVQEWFWVGVFAVAVAAMVLATVGPWLMR